METQQQEKKKAAPKRSTYASLRIRRETKRQIAVHLDAINKKDFGRRVRAEEYLALALSLITPQHLEALQEASLSNADRLERDYRAFIAEHGPISRDEYLGKRLAGEAPPPKTKIQLTT
jgi:hypothetical protein